MSKLSNWELLEIVYRKDDYDPLAVEAAQFEFDSRKLTDKQLNQARKRVLDRAVLIQQEKETAVQIEKALEDFGKQAVDTLHPLRQKTTRSIIWVVCIYLLLISIFYLYQNWYLIKDLVRSNSLIDFLLLPSIIVIPIIVSSILLLLLKKRSGWALLILYLVYLAVNISFKFFQAVLILLSKDAHLINTLLKTNYTGSMIFGFTSIALLIYFNSKRIKDYFKVSTDTQIKILIGTLLLSLLYWSGIANQ